MANMPPRAPSLNQCGIGFRRKLNVFLRYCAEEACFAIFLCNEQHHQRMVKTQSIKHVRHESDWAITDSQFEERLVERPGEERVEQVLVHQGQPQQPPAEPEPVQVVVHERRQWRYLGMLQE